MTVLIPTHNNMLTMTRTTMVDGSTSNSNLRPRVPVHQRSPHRPESMACRGCGPHFLSLQRTKLNRLDDPWRGVLVDHDRSTATWAFPDVPAIHDLRVLLQVRFFLLLEAICT